MLATRGRGPPLRARGAASTAVSGPYPGVADLTEGSPSSPGPLGVLKHDAIAVRVLKGPAGAIPVRIERGDGLVARRDHPVDGLLPLRSVGEVEDEQVVLGGRPAREVATLSRELEMVRG